MKIPTKMEELVLVSIFRLGEEAYGVQIQKQISRMTGRKVLYSTLYAAFDQLVRKGYISKHFGAPTAVRGGKRKVYFKLTQTGFLVLKDAFQTQKTVWTGISEEALQRGS